MKRIFLLIMSVTLGLTLFAQGNPGGCYKHVIDVEAYPDWGKGYLTVIDPHYYHIYGDDGVYPETFEPMGEGYFPGLADVILSVNGKSTLNMTPDEFYAIVDKSDEFMLTFINRKGEKFTQRYSVIRTYSSLGKYWREADEDDKCWGCTYPGKREKTCSGEYNEVADRNIDFQKIRTYDYLIVGDDPLNDSKILDQIPKWFGMERDTKNPDVIFTIAKNADERIESTYIPPTSRTINTGSRTSSSYNSFTKGYDYVTRQRYQTIHEGGYTETTKTANVFLELAALDSKRINDKSINYAPIIWQYTAMLNAVNYDFKIMDVYNAYASWAAFPPYDRWVKVEYIIYEKSGLVADENNPKVVGDVKSGSRAEKAGFHKGDIIKKIEVRYWDGWKTYKMTNGVELFDGYNGHFNWYVKDLYCRDVRVTVKRNGKKVLLTLYPHQKNMYIDYLRGGDCLK